MLGQVPGLLVTYYVGVENILVSVLLLSLAYHGPAGEGVTVPADLLYIRCNKFSIYPVQPTPQNQPVQLNNILVLKIDNFTSNKVSTNNGKFQPLFVIYASLILIFFFC